MNGLLEQLRVQPGTPAGLRSRPTSDPSGLDADKATTVDELLPTARERIGALQERLHAEAARSLLLVLQGTDTSGKDGTIRKVLGGTSPSSTRVAAFISPSTTELAHDYLWRVHAACPARGEIGVFNRSHYEDVVATRVRHLVDEATWRRRFRHLREFERLLHDEGTTVVKCFLHISKDEQLERLRARLREPEKRWKLQRSDFDDRNLWDEHLAAYEDALTETSTDWAPWYVVPADRKWQRNLVVAELLVATLTRMDPQVPPASPEIEGIDPTTLSTGSEGR